MPRSSWLALSVTARVASSIFIDVSGLIDCAVQGGLSGFFYMRGNFMWCSPSDAAKQCSSDGVASVKGIWTHGSDVGIILKHLCMRSTTICPFYIQFVHHDRELHFTR